MKWVFPKKNRTILRSSPTSGSLRGSAGQGGILHSHQSAAQRSPFGGDNGHRTWEERGSTPLIISGLSDFQGFTCAQNKFMPSSQRAKKIETYMD